MKNVTKAVVTAFIAGKARAIGSTSTDGTVLLLHGNRIAWKNPNGAIKATLAGWPTVTTRERLNGLCVALGLGHLFSQRDFVQHFRDKPVKPDAVVTLVPARKRKKPAAPAPEGWETCSGPVDVQGRLEYLRGELRAERISYAELAELQGLADHIDPNDVELREAAGLPEAIAAAAAAT